VKTVKIVKKLRALFLPHAMSKNSLAVSCVNLLERFTHKYYVEYSNIYTYILKYTIFRIANFVNPNIYVHTSLLETGVVFFQ